ncbi:MAG: type II toxin-antitoxin system prevent-host-death family antitoxin [Dehalococcoidia bacterium]
MVQVSVRELKNKLAEYIRRAESGEEVVVTRRGKTVISLIRPPGGGMSLDEKWKDLERRGIVHLGKGGYVPPKRRIKLRGEGPSVSEMVLADRGEPIP